MSNLIIGFTRHLNFGTILIPYLCKCDSEDSILAEEQATELSFKDASLTDVEKEIIRISFTYSEKNLMRAYSKEKKVSDFLHKLKEETLKKEIRPFIERKQLEIIDLIRKNDLPMYFKEAGKKRLYTHNRIKTTQQNVDVMFEFRVNKETFSYTIICKYGGNPVCLTEKKPIHVLTSYPACILARNELLVFNGIQANRLLPFFKKEDVKVSASMTKKYMEQIVLPAIASFDVDATGFNIKEELVKRRVELSIDKSIINKPTIKLEFWYNDHRFISEIDIDNKKKEVEMKEENGLFSFIYFARDAKWERECITQLEAWGLSLDNDLHFLISEKSKQKTVIEWFETHNGKFKKKFN